jgi:hypothetical protein
MERLDAKKVPSMVMGSVAASVLGELRLTQDIDALAIVPEADWDARSTFFRISASSDATVCSIN